QPSDLSRLLTGTTNRKVHEFWLRSRAQSHVVLGGHCRNGVCLAPAANCIMREWRSVRHDLDDMNCRMRRVEREFCGANGCASVSKNGNHKVIGQGLSCPSCWPQSKDQSRYI